MPFKSHVTLFISKIQAFSKDEILNLIPKDILDTIKTSDPKPFFQAYSLCHEGVSSPTLIGETAEPITWTRRAIQSIKNVITKGVKFFFGHNDDNTTSDRRVLGEVVASTQQEIDGKLHHVVIAYHSPEVREEVKNYDICSQEAEWNFFKEAGKMVADTIDKLTGIALQSSTHEKPAFAGAKRLAMVQAFSQPIDVEPVKIIKKEGKKQMTFQEIIQAVKEMNIFPSQLYNIDDLQKDRGFSSYFSEKEQTEKDLQDSKKEVEDMKTNHKDLIRQSSVMSAKTRLGDILKEVKPTDLQKTFIDLNFSENIDDLSDDGLKNFVSSQLVNFKKLTDAKLIGGGEIPAIIDNKTPPVDGDDLTKAENNELLQEDYEQI